MSKIIEIYESASADGYSLFGDGVYFTEKHQAEHFSRAKHGGCSRCEAHAAIQTKSGEIYLLKRTTPVVMKDSREYNQKIKEAALAKLSEEEKRLLGL